MVKSSDLARGRQAIEENRSRQVVHQHETNQQPSFFKSEILPRMGIVGFLAGWSLMSALNNLLKDRSSDR